MLFPQKQEDFFHSRKESEKTGSFHCKPVRFLPVFFRTHLKLEVEFGIINKILFIVTSGLMSVRFRRVLGKRKIGEVTYDTGYCTSQI